MRILSGAQPTGHFHIGNYLGAIKQFLEYQEKNECIFFIADLHALTIPYKPENLQKDILEIAIAYLASGLKPEKCIFFVQSQIPEHTELVWLLSVVCPVGDLLRMTQYKEKSKQFKKNINAGLLNYPILQAADILLYQPDIVPVGKDQKQHIELTRTIAKNFNNRFGKTFKIPELQLSKTGAKIMALDKPAKKMSKSAPEGCLFIFDEPEIIKKKIMRAITDLGRQIKYDPVKKAGISNLLTIFSLLSNKSIKELEKKFQNANYENFKKSLIALLIDYFEPLRQKRKELLSREVYVREILEQGRKRAEKIAQSTILEVKTKMGLI